MLEISQNFVAFSEYLNFQLICIYFQMGYAKQGQNTKGIHIRQFSRAFIFEQDGERNVYVSADCGMMGQLVKMKVIIFH